MHDKLSIFSADIKIGGESVAGIDTRYVDSGSAKLRPLESTTVESAIYST